MKTNIHFLLHLAHFFLESEMFQTKFVEEMKTLIFCSTFFFLENRAVYEVMWKNMVQLGRPQMTIWGLRIACWVTKATNTHTGCAILIAFPQQQWLHERSSMLRYTYIACLVKTG
jgi:hypothetical protein